VAILFLVTYVYHHISSSTHQNYSLLKNLRLNDEKKNQLRYAISVDNCETPALENASAEYIESYKDRKYLQKEIENICSKFPDFSKIENDTLYLTNQNVSDCCVSSITRPWKDPQDDYVLNSTCVPFTNEKIDISGLEFLMVTCKDQKSSQSPLYNFHAHVPTPPREQNFSEVYQKPGTSSTACTSWISLGIIHQENRPSFFEDDPIVGTFNYGGQIGFEEQPTTLYTRPLMIYHTKMTKRDTLNYYKRYCFGQRNVIQFLLDYHFKILDILSEVPTFQVTWPCWPQHDLGGSLRILDDTYSNFFKTVSENKQILENTLLIVTSDHGFYSKQENRYPVSFNGLVERRNVPLFIRLPDKLRRVYPEMQENLGMNSKSITSHYDIYQTLLHIAKMAGNVDPLTNLTTHGASLLSKIPQNRTCKEARIPKTMCLCQLDTNSFN
ncbi:unnamed protein product, partial [Allacma fusca]